MKKGGVALITITLILAVILLVSFIMSAVTRECNSNTNCQADSYCGSDNQCHQYPKEVIVKKNDFVLPAIIVGVALVASTYLKRKKIIEE